MEMKKDCTTADGKAVGITEEVNGVLAQFERDDKNERRKARGRNEASVEGLYEETGWEPADTTVDIAREYEKKEELETLAKAIAGLTEKQQWLVRLRYYEEKTTYEIAAIFGINQSNVQRQLDTIHKRLKEILENF